MKNVDVIMKIEALILGKLAEEVSRLHFGRVTDCILVG